MDWNAIGTTAAQVLVPLLITALVTLGITLYPQAHAFLVLKVGETRLKTIEDGLSMAVRATEAQLGLDNGPAKKEFCVRWAQAFFDSIHLNVQAAPLGDMVEAALLKEKMAGLKLVAAVPLAALADPGPLRGNILPVIGQAPPLSAAN